MSWDVLRKAPEKYIDDGLLGIIEGLSKDLQKPFNITLCENSLRAVLLLFTAYFMGIALYWSMRKNYRRGEEHGSARWGNPLEISRRYQQKSPEANKLLTKNVRLGLDGRILLHIHL